MQPVDQDPFRYDMPAGSALVFCGVSSYLSPMCNDYEQQIAWAEYCRMMRALELGVPTQQSGTDLPRADRIRINDIGPVMRASGNGIELAPMRFGFPPPKPRGAPIFNFRSEGRDFAQSKRCLIPASPQRSGPGGQGQLRKLGTPESSEPPTFAYGLSC